MKKYILLEEDCCKISKSVVHRIKAIRDGLYFKKGDLGGYIKSEDNLSQSDDSWISEKTYVLGNAKVSGDSLVSSERAIIIYNQAIVKDHSTVKGNLSLGGKTVIRNSTVIGLDKDNGVKTLVTLKGETSIDHSFVEIQNDLYDVHITCSYVRASIIGPNIDIYLSNIISSSILNIGSKIYSTLIANTIVKSIEDYQTYLVWWDWHDYYDDKASFANRTQCPISITYDKTRGTLSFGYLGISEKRRFLDEKEPIVQFTDIYSFERKLRLLDYYLDKPELVDKIISSIKTKFNIV